MARIIKEEKQSEETEIICKHCKCVFSYLPHEIKKIKDIFFVICPDCHANIVLKQMVNRKKKKIKGHCNMCNSDIIFEWTNSDDYIALCKIEQVMRNFARDNYRCLCSMMKINKRDE